MPTGPTANLPGYSRRSGKAGTVWRDGRMLGEVQSVEWTVEIEQIEVALAGTYRTETKPGGETRRGTFRVQDVDDAWKLQVWNFLDMRRRNVKEAAYFPEFEVITKIADIGAPDETRWALSGCQLFSYDGGHSVDDDLLIRDVPFTFRFDRPLHAYYYADSGIVIVEK